MSSTHRFSKSFHSIRKRNDFDRNQLQLNIVCFNNNALEVELVNLLYNQQRSTKLKQIVGLISCYAIYRTVDLLVDTNTTSLQDANWTKIALIDVTFLCLLVSLISSTLQLIKSEKLLTCQDFALQLQTLWFFSRKSSVFIPSAHIYDVCINEVIEDLDVHYILILRTKASLFHKKPVVPIFNTLKPQLDCLEVVYKYLQQTLNKKQDFTNLMQ